MKKHRLVAQEDRWGCGVACVASAVGISYDQAKQELVSYKGRAIDSPRYGLDLGPIIKVLADHGIEVTKNWSATRWPVGTIVFLFRDWGRYKGTGHYMLKTSKGWMDPWKNVEDASPVAGYWLRLPRNAGVQVALIPVAG